MSYDLAIWKRSPTTKTAMLDACYQAIIDGTDHEAMARFDDEPLMAGLEKAFGTRHTQWFGDDADKAPFLYETGSGEHGNWMLLTCTYSAIQQVFPVVADLAVGQGLMVDDPQRGAVWGNRRTK